MYPSSTFSSLPLPTETAPSYLQAEELCRLTESYLRWFEEPQGKRYRRKERARQWVIFLLLRYSGARVSEVLQVDDVRDVDFREALVTLPTLKRHSPRKKGLKRSIPIPAHFLGEMGRILAEFPSLRGQLFRCHRSTVYRCFRARAQEAKLPANLCHPHVLRHTRAIELLRAGVPVTVVQEILGHASLSTTALYLRFSGREIKTILKDRGFL